TEQVTFRPATSNIPFDIAISNDGKTAWAAVRNPGFVQAIDTVSGNILASIPVPNAVRLVLSPQSTKLLVFADDPQSLSPANPVFLINTANVTSSTPVTTITGAGLDQPFTAVFNGENQAFILSCGAECGGTTASVTPLDLSGASPVLGAPVSVSGATTGLLNAGTLFVAGTPPAANLPAGFCPAVPGVCGTLQAIDANSLSAGEPVAITDGLHQKMAFTSNNHLYVGAANCTTQPSGTNQVRGCLSIFDTGASTVTFPTESVFRQDFDVTGLQQISGRNVIYVVQGGELDFFDITTSAVSTTITPLDVVGKAIDVVQIDP
ncbi:MAG: YncE family protein, partial [Candidatus Angelobacter sp.]